MSQGEGVLAQRALELRRAFDRSFAEAPAADVAPEEPFLAIELAGDGYALRLGEIAGLHVDKKVMPLPSALADLIGIASFRGALVPIYDLRALLGYPSASVPRWLVLAESATPVGLAFDRFIAYLSAPPDAIARGGAAQSGRQHAAQSVSAAGKIWPIINVRSVVESIRKRTQTVVSQRE